MRVALPGNRQCAVLSPTHPCSHSRCEDNRLKGIPRLVQRSLYEGPVCGWYRGVPVGVCRPPSAGGRVYCAVASSPGRSAVASQCCQFCVRNYPCYGARPRAQSRGQAPTVASPLTSLPIGISVLYLIIYSPWQPARYPPVATFFQLRVFPLVLWGI